MWNGWNYIDFLYSISLTVNPLELSPPEYSSIFDIESERPVKAFLKMRLLLCIEMPDGCDCASS